MICDRMIQIEVATDSVDGFPPITGVCCFSRVGKMFGFVWMNVLFGIMSAVGH